MKKMILTLVALLSMTTMTAQTTNESTTNEQAKGQRPAMRGKRMSHEDMTKQMATKLNLDEAQKAKVAALNKEYQNVLMPQPPMRPKGERANGDENTQQQTSADQQRPALNNNGQKPDFKAMQAKRQEYETKLKAILSDEQFTNYQKMGPPAMRQGKNDGTRKAKKAKKQQTQE